LKRFRDELAPELQRRGWWGRQEMRDPDTGETREVQLGSPRRLKVIYDTNLRTAYAAGHWARIDANKRSAPYVLYSAILDGRTRAQHRAWNGKVLRADDPWWKTHTPPNGWNCRCTVVQLSERDLRKLGKTGPDEAPPAPTREWPNPRTGEIVQVPVGVDPGFGYAPGASRRADVAQLAMEKIADRPADLGAAAFAAVRPIALPQIEVAWAARVREIARDMTAGRTLHTIGAFDPDVVSYLTRAGQMPASAALTVTDQDVLHMLRASKAGRGAALTVEDLERVPAILASPQTTLYDRVDPAVVFVFPAEAERLGKIVVRVNFTQTVRGATPRQKVRTNAVRTAGYVARRNLDDPRYDVIKGKL